MEFLLRKLDFSSIRATNKELAGGTKAKVWISIHLPHSVIIEIDDNNCNKTIKLRLRD